MVTALATTLSGLVVLVSVLLILAQVRQQGREEFVAATAGTFRVWMESRLIDNSTLLQDFESMLPECYWSEMG